MIFADRTFVEVKADLIHSILTVRVFLSVELCHCAKCPYSEFFWSVFSRIRTEYAEILRISPYSARMRENTDQKNFEYGHFSRSTFHLK